MTDQLYFEVTNDSELLKLLESIQNLSTQTQQLIETKIVGIEAPMMMSVLRLSAKVNAIEVLSIRAQHYIKSKAAK